MGQDITLSANFLSPTTIYLKGATLTYTFKHNIRADPTVNNSDIVEVQTAGYENPRIVITGFIDTNNLSSSDIQHKHLLSLAKQDYDGTSSTEITLTVRTGDSDEPLYASDGTTNTINVVVESFTLRLSAQDSKYGHLWQYTLNLIETK